MYKCQKFQGADAASKSSNEIEKVEKSVNEDKTTEEPQKIDDETDESQDDENDFSDPSTTAESLLKTAVEELVNLIEPLCDLQKQLTSILSNVRRLRK